MLVLYGITGALFSYCVSLITESPLAAFAVVAGYQVIMFIVRFLTAIPMPIFNEYSTAVCGGLSLDVNIREDFRGGEHNNYPA